MTSDMDVGGVMRGLIHAFDWLALLYFFGINSVYAILLILCIPELIRRSLEIQSENLKGVLGSEAMPKVALLAPAYNEASTIRQSIQSMLNLPYPRLEIIVINDGSRDSTLEVLKKEFDLIGVPPVMPEILKTRPVRRHYRSRSHPDLVVLDKENGGKSDALNAGLNAATAPLVLAMDADTLIEPESISKLVRAVVTDSDIVATGGTIRVANGCTVSGGRVVDSRFPSSLLAGFQVVEYLRAFLFGRLGWNRLGGNLNISGAFGLFHRQAVVEAGGYARDTVGEDIELVVRLHRIHRESGRPCKVPFIPDPVAWTEVPESVKNLSRQRDRWHRGLIETMVKHRRMLFNPAYGMVGLVSFPYFFIGEMLAPIIEAVGFIGIGVGWFLGIVDLKFFLLFLAVAWGYGLLLSVSAVLMEEMTFRRYRRPSDIAKMFLVFLLEAAGYRQINVSWRLRAFWNYAKGVKTWGDMERKGFAKA